MRVRGLFAVVVVVVAESEGEDGALALAFGDRDRERWRAGMSRLGRVTEDEDGMRRGGNGAPGSRGEAIVDMLCESV